MPNLAKKLRERRITNKLRQNRIPSNMFSLLFRSVTNTHINTSIRQWESSPVHMPGQQMIHRQYKTTNHPDSLSLSLSHYIGHNGHAYPAAAGRGFVVSPSRPSGRVGLSQPPTHRIRSSNHSNHNSHTAARMVPIVCVMGMLMYVVGCNYRANDRKREAGLNRMGCVRFVCARGLRLGEHAGPLIGMIASGQAPVLLECTYSNARVRV